MPSTFSKQQKVQLIASKLDLAMKEDKLFLQDSLSLNKLSESISETENHISETLSQFLHTKFFNLLMAFESKKRRSLYRIATS